MKLIVIDIGDRAVGIFEQRYVIDVPLEQDSTKEDLLFFKEGIRKLYAEFAETKLVVFYDFESHIYDP